MPPKSSRVPSAARFTRFSARCAPIHCRSWTSRKRRICKRSVILKVHEDRTSHHRQPARHHLHRSALCDRELLRETSNAGPIRTAPARRHHRPLGRDPRARPLSGARLLQPVRLRGPRELGYSDAAAARRIGAMRLCADLHMALDASGGVARRLADAERRRGAAVGVRPAAVGAAGRSCGTAAIAPVGSAAGSAAQNDPAADSAPAVPLPSAEPEPPPPLVLDAVGRQQLVDGSGRRQERPAAVRQMLADLDPELAPPADRVRPLGDGRYELKATIDAECQQGLEQLRGAALARGPAHDAGAARRTPGQGGARPPRPEPATAPSAQRRRRRGREGKHPANSDAGAGARQRRSGGEARPASGAHRGGAEDRPERRPRRHSGARPARSVRPIPSLRAAADEQPGGYGPPSRYAGAKPTGAHHRHGHAQGRSPREPAP